MNEVIEKYYQAEIEYSSDKLLNREMESKWKALSHLSESTSDDAKQLDVFTAIGDIWSESAKVGFYAGFRAALRFMMNL